MRRLFAVAAAVGGLAMAAPARAADFPDIGDLAAELGVPSPRPSGREFAASRRK